MLAPSLLRELFVCRGIGVKKERPSETREESILGYHRMKEPIW